MKPEKWVDLALGFLAAVLFFIVREALIGLWDLARLATLDLPLQWWDFIAGAVALAGFIFAKRDQRVQAFGHDVVVELGKVTWPEKKETWLSTVIVMVMVGISSILLFLVDTVWGTLSRSIVER